MNKKFFCLLFVTVLFTQVVSALELVTITPVSFVGYPQRGATDLKSPFTKNYYFYLSLDPSSSLYNPNYCTSTYPILPAGVFCGWPPTPQSSGWCACNIYEIQNTCDGLAQIDFEPFTSLTVG